jgi:hypothetical protein
MYPFLCTDTKAIPGRLWQAGSLAGTIRTAGSKVAHNVIFWNLGDTWLASVPEWVGKVRCTGAELPNLRMEMFTPGLKSGPALPLSIHFNL